MEFVATIEELLLAGDFCTFLRIMDVGNDTALKRSPETQKCLSKRELVARAGVFRKIESCEAN